MSDQTQGTGPQGQQGSSAPGALTEEKVQAMITETFNSGFTARMKTAQRAIADDVAKALGPISSKLEEMGTAIAGLQGGKNSKKPKDGEDPNEGTPEYRGLQKQLADQKSAFDKLQNELAAEKSRAADATMRTQVIDDLVKHGVDASRAKRAMQILVDGDKRVKRDEDGATVFVDSDGQPIDLTTGLKAWVKTEDAKIFLPPTGVRGSGGQPGSGPNAGNTKGQPQELTATDLGLAIARDFGGIPVST